MKKLMVAAAAAMLGIVANAAAVVSWDAGDIYLSDLSGKLATDYLVFYVDAGTYSYESALADITKDGGADLGFLSLSSTYKQAGEYDGDGFVMNETAARYSALETVTAYAVILDSTTIDGAKNVWITDGTKSDKIGENEQPGYIGFNTSASKTTGWYTVVPEPTSGLLLLLGVAGLALRRRRA